MNYSIEDNTLIAAHGGTASVAKLCKISPQAVSQWRTDGIPSARRQYLELLLANKQTELLAETDGQ